MMRLFVVVCLAAAVGAMYAPDSDVVQLTPANFDKEVMQFKGVVLVEFYAPWCGHCKTLAPEWEKAAKALAGVVKVAAVDADKHRSLGERFKVEGFPTVFAFGENKAAPTQFEQRTAKGIVPDALKAAAALANDRLNGKSKGGSSGGAKKEQQKDDGKTHVITLSDDDFDEKVTKTTDLWLVEFYAPWCGHCKTLAPEWKAAAADLVGMVKLGAVDVTANKALGERFAIKGFPTIKFFGPDKTAAENYEGSRVHAGIVKWALAEFDLYGPPMVIPEINNQANFMSQCVLLKKICVAVALPPIFDTTADERTKTIAMLADVAKKFRTASISIVWFSGGSQTAFEDTFRLTMNYPTFVAISHSKMRYGVHKGSFTVTVIADELTRILDGRASTSVLAAMPPPFLETAPWDGKDYVSPPEDQ